MNKLKMLYCEFGTAHNDSMFSFMSLVEENYEIHLLTNPLTAERVPQTINYKSKHIMEMEHRSPWLVGFKAALIVRRLKPDVVFINTAQGNFVRAFILMLPIGTKIRGVHHNAVKLLGSFSQSIISWRLKHYIVLADYIEINLKPLLKNGVTATTFYASYLEMPPQDYKLPTEVLQRIENKTIVAIPGVVELNRRDYHALIAALKKVPPPENLMFLILGNSARGDGPWLRQQIQSLNLEKNFMFFEGFVPTNVVYACLQRSDALIPLMHPGMDYFDDFSKYKISGTYNLAYGFNIPMLMHNALHKTPYFNTISIGYETDQLGELLASLPTKKSILDTLRKNIENDPRLNKENQKKTLLNYLT